MNLVEKLIEMDRTSPRRILVIGDSMTDMYVHGTLQDCQDGCKKFVQNSEFIVPGGAANAGRSLENWNAEVKCMYEIYCKQQAPMKVRFLVDDKIVYRWDNDNNSLDLKLYREQANIMLSIWKPHGVLLSDYDKGLLTPDFLREVITYCKDKNIPCVADAKRNPRIYEGAIVKANQEWYDKWGYSGTETMPHVMTCGKYAPVVHGKVPWGNEEELPSINCINHVGAGDCFAAHLILALGYEFSLKESAAIANSAGRVYVQRRHNEPPFPLAILEDMNGRT